MTWTPSHKWDLLFLVYRRLLHVCQLRCAVTLCLRQQHLDKLFWLIQEREVSRIVYNSHLCAAAGGVWLSSVINYTKQDGAQLVITYMPTVTGIIY